MIRCRSGRAPPLIDLAHQSIDTSTCVHCAVALLDLGAQGLFEGLSALEVEGGPACGACCVGVGCAVIYEEDVVRVSAQLFRSGVEGGQGGLSVSEAVAEQ